MTQLVKTWSREGKTLADSVTSAYAIPDTIEEIIAEFEGERLSGLAGLRRARMSPSLRQRRLALLVVAAAMLASAAFEAWLLVRIF